MNFDNEKIFVSIASYRDPDIQNTIDSLLDNADCPDDINICILDQWGDHPNEVRPQPKKNIEVIRIPYQSAKGCGWARSVIQGKVKDEKYYLQIDAHSRFKPGWDTFNVLTTESLVRDDVTKPILSTTPPVYSKVEDKPWHSSPTNVLCTGKFDDDGNSCRAGAIPRTNYIDEPLNTPWLIGCYIFSHTTFVHEVPWDPNHFFFGDEDAMSIRAFTHGFDIFAPHSCLVAHDFDRSDRDITKGGPGLIWDNHVEEADFVKTSEQIWHNRDKKSKARLDTLVRNKDADMSINLGKYGLGDKRSLEEFEKFAMIDYRNKKVLCEDYEEHYQFLERKHHEQRESLH